ncbi:MAG TPA: carbohydrate kinase [Anaerolineaceae bacterium]|nr:carbohydrate kinase [Anaerolineaceae bacterium]
MKYFMGIDIGTYESKGVLIDENCKIIASYRVPNTLENPEPQFFEHDAETEWWGNFCKLSNTLITDSGIDPSHIACVGSSALGADCLPVDENCNPLRKAILYGIDARADKEMATLTELYGPQNIEKYFGRPICSSDVAPKILWVKNNEPDVYERTFKFLTATSYLTAKLTGEYFIDKYLINTFAPAYRSDGTVDEEAVMLFCRPDQLALCRETTEVVGTVTAVAAKQTGLAEGTPVLTGTDDAGAEAISTGIFQPGDMMIMIGSSCYMIYCSDHEVIDERIWHDAFIIPGTYSVSAGTNTAGTLTRWYRDHLFFDALQEQERTDRNAYEIMLDGLYEIAPGSDGLITLPYFAGERTPLNDPFAKGMIFGLKLNHTRQHLYRSALEGVAYSIAQHFDILQEHNLPLKKIMAVGGGSQNLLWLQIIADVSGQVIHRAAVNIGASFGDALMAGLGCGHFHSFSDLSDLIRPDTFFVPDEERNALYQPYRKRFAQLYSSTRDLMHEL